METRIEKRIERMARQIRLGDFLRQQREKRELTQKTIADMIGLTPASISNIEMGEQAINAVDLIDWANIYGIEPFELLKAMGKPSEK